MFSWKKLHPDWQFVFWTDRERTAVFDGMEVRQVTDALFTKLSEQYHLSLNYGEKSDILRLEILNKEGGIYMDHDALCLHAFDPLCESFDFFVGLERPHAGTCSSIFPCIGMFGSVPSHPILQDTINRISDSWEESTKQYLQESVATLVV